MKVINRKPPAAPKHIPADRVFDFDMFADVASNPDPQAAHIALHGTAPDIFFTPRNGGHWMATRYADIQKIMLNSDLFSSKVPALGISLPPQDMDAPEHPLYRLLLMKFLSPKETIKLEPQIRALMTALIDSVIDKRRCEFVEDISVPLPVKTFMGMMQMDMARYSQFVSWVNAILASESLWQRLPALIRMRFYLKSLIRMRKKNLGDDPVSQLLTSEIKGKPLTDTRVLEICNLLFLAGLDTVTNGMTFIARHLAENLDLQQRLRGNPEQIPAAIEELMRRYPFVSVPRRVTRDMEFNGVFMRKNDLVFASLAAGSNDERRVECPFKVDLDRPKLSHLAFNTGPHNCAGITLARLEMRIFVEEWLARVPPFHLAEDYEVSVRGGPIMAIKFLELRW